MSNDLMQKLMISKAIMDKHNNIPRGQNIENPTTQVESFQPVNGKYNIPNDIISQEGSQINENTKPVGDVTVEAIQKSKLPDAIKKLMIENPIQPQQQPQATISSELIEKASRLMKKNEPTTFVEQNKSTSSKVLNTTIDYNKIQEMIDSAIQKNFKQNGLLVESEEKTNDTFSFRVGNHVFEGKISKIKKIK